MGGAAKAAPLFFVADGQRVQLHYARKTLEIQGLEGTLMVVMCSIAVKYTSGESSIMSIFDKIKKAIFGEAEAAEAQPSMPNVQASTSVLGVDPQETAAAPAASSPATTSPVAPGSAANITSPDSSNGSALAQAIDIEPVLDDAVRRNGQKLDWRRSVVDLMKAVGMEASLAERKELAEELGYSGDINDSATMNMWLHKALMRKLSENGGKVPGDLID